MVRQAYSQFDNMKPWQVYFARVLISFDQLINVFLAGFPDETLSGRIGRAMASGKPKWFVPSLEALVDSLFERLLNEKEHCKNSIEHEDQFNTRPELWRWYKVKKISKDEVSSK